MTGDVGKPGTVAIVTGSTSGIGLAVAQRLVTQGSRVMFNSRARTPPAGILSASSADRVDFCSGDIAREDDASSIVSQTLERWGRVDYLINNAGRTSFIPHHDLNAATTEIWNELLATNLLGTWNMIKLAAPHLASVQGAIVNVASIAGVTASGSSVPYAVSKAGVIHLTKLMARALGPAVRVNAVAPGLVETPWHASSDMDWQGYSAKAPLGRFAQPDDIAEVICSLLFSKYVTGQIMNLDGGNSL